MLCFPEKPSLRPCIAELLRTCVHPPSLLLRVERIVVEQVSSLDDDNYRNASSVDGYDGELGTIELHYRLLLSDGVLMVQAMLHEHLHPFLATKRIIQDTLINLKNFCVRRAKRFRDTGEVVYLGISDLEVVSDVEPASKTPDCLVQTVDDNSRDDELSLRRRLIDLEGRKTPSHSPSKFAVHFSASIHDLDFDEPSSFETTTIDSHAVNQRRQILHELSANKQLEMEELRQTDETGVARKRRRLNENVPFPTLLPSTSCAQLTKLEEPNAAVLERSLAEEPKLQASPSTSKQFSHSSPRRSLSEERPLSSHRLKPTPPLHSLHSLLHPSSALPRSYACSVFALISWVSPSTIHRRPFPPKRHIKIHDPSISNRYSGITVAVFIDAREFKPSVGTIALFRGVLMQRWENEVILNAYSNLKGTSMWEGQEWYLDDEDRLAQMGHDVRGLKSWWVERVARRGKG